MSGEMIRLTSMEHTKLRNGLQVCKLINGMWQVSGAHGDIDKIDAGKLSFLQGHFTRTKQF